MRDRERPLLFHGSTRAAVAAALLLAAPVGAVEPGEQILVDTSASSHGVLLEQSLTLNVRTGCASCEVTTSPDRIELFASRNLVGVNEVAGFMAREFSLSPSVFGTANEVDALIRFDLRINGDFLAIGRKASAEVQVIASVDDVTGSVQIARGLAAALGGQGGGENVSVSAPGTPVGFGVPIPLPKLEQIANQSIRHFVTLPLKRGHTYRLRVEFRGSAQQELAPLTGISQSAELNFAGGNPLPVAAPGVDGGLHWDQAVVLVQHDGFERLEQLMADLAQHDADVKAELTRIEEQLTTLQRLILTPAGRLPRFPVMAPRALLQRVVDEHCASPTTDPDECSRAQFCAAQETRFACSNADYEETEPVSSQDCRWARGSCVPR
jgi:hypothetical protein